MSPILNALINTLIVVLTLILGQTPLHPLQSLDRIESTFQPIKSQALATDDPNLCLGLQQEAWYWGEIIEGKGDISHGVIERYPRQECLNAVSQATTNPETCRTYSRLLGKENYTHLEGEERTKQEQRLSDICVTSLAERLDDAETCIYASTERRCRALTLLDPDYCFTSEGTYETQTSSCIFEITKRNGDVALCELITEDDWDRDACIGLQLNNAQGEKRNLVCDLMRKYNPERATKDARCYGT